MKVSVIQKSYFPFMDLSDDVRIQERVFDVPEKEVEQYRAAVDVLLIREMQVLTRIEPQLNKILKKKPTATTTRVDRNRYHRARQLKNRLEKLREEVL